MTIEFASPRLARWSLAFATAAICLAAVVNASGDSLDWRKREGRVDARIETWDMPALLARLSEVTGWGVYLEPGTTNRVSVKFKNAPAAEALKLLLGDLNFAVIPARNRATNLYVFRTSVSQATQVIALAKESPEGRHPKAIPNELIVSLKPGGKESIEELARRLGAKVAGKADGWNSYRLQFTDEAAARAAERELASLGIDFDNNFSLDRPTRANPLDAPGAPSFPLKPKVSKDSSQVIVGLIDTAVQPLPEDMKGFVLPSLNVAGEPASANSELSHGTSMAQTLLHGLTLAPEENGGSSVRILPVDVYGTNEGTTTFDVARGIYSAINAGATIINLSLSGDGDSQFLARMIQDARKEGVLFFAAAGNEPTAEPSFPAAYPGVVAVTAVDRRGRLAPYANRGDFVDIGAPGTSAVQFGGETYIVTGTSSATAYASGAAAGLRSAGKSPDEVDQALREALSVRPPSPSARKQP